jgi:hypothetical protein
MPWIYQCTRCTASNQIQDGDHYCNIEFLTTKTLELLYLSSNDLK